MSLHPLQFFFQFLLLTFSLCILCNFRQVTTKSGFQRIGNNLIVLMITVPQYIGLSVFLSFCLLGEYTSYFATFKWSFLDHKYSFRIFGQTKSYVLSSIEIRKNQENISIMELLIYQLIVNYVVKLYVARLL